MDYNTWKAEADVFFGTHYGSLEVYQREYTVNSNDFEMHMRQFVAENHVGRLNALEISKLNIEHMNRYTRELHEKAGW